MNSYRTIIAIVALSGTAALGLGTVSHAASGAKPDGLLANELSAAKRHYHRGYVRHPGPRYSSYQRGNDPSLGADGLPYRVPPHLRNQCYIDDGYGRFSACPNH